MFGTVLFVDDETNILRTLRRSFIDEPYNCLFALSASDALEIVSLNTVNVIISDLYMPGMNGILLLKNVADQYPQIHQIALSGHPIATHNVAAISGSREITIFTKPWKPDKLKITIREMINQDAHELKQESWTA